MNPPQSREQASPGLRFGIVGGGMLGMTLALRLRQAGHAVTLWEAGDEWGGLASAWQLDDLRWDRHYHVTLASDSHTRALLRELGLDEEMCWVKTRTALAAKGKLHPLDNALDYWRLPVLNAVEKMRLAGTIVWASRIRDWRRLEQIPVETWLRRCSGHGTFEKLWRPLLESKLGSHWRVASAAFLWTTIQRLYKARRSGMKEELLGYLPGGYGRTLDRFHERLVAAGVRTHLSCPVRSVERREGKLSVTTEDGVQSVDRVVITTTPRVAAKVLPQLAGVERSRFEGVRYQGIVCASLLLRRPLSGAYLTYLTDAGIPFTGIVEMSAMVEPREFGDRHLVYLPRYCDATDPAFDWSDEEIQRRFLVGLRRVHPNVRDADLLAFRTSRVKEVFPLPVLGYSTTLPPEQTSVPGVRVINSARILNGTLNVNETVQLAEEAAARLLAEESLERSR